ncbi:MAG: hypothetical protein JJU05_10710 [Verrucomicrobia bacterium]|nr:hypothetical protein [Verrucomicrobiota bacterium]MCH8528630.1 hypothetical protein [Kiritimatiellia bacterium]
MKAFLVVLVFGFCVAGRSVAGTEALEAAVRRAGDFLVDQVNEENEWMLPPQRSRQRLGREPVEVRYREELVEVPVFAEEEREIVVRPRETSGEGVRGLERRVIRVRGEQTGTRMERRLVRDPEGAIVRRENRVIWGAGGPDEWAIGRFGSNAMAGVALLRSGHPEAERVVNPMLDFFGELVRSEGPPDMTRDLAWMIVLFAESERESVQNLVPGMMAKLMAGQVREGPGAGLWGPLALNAEVLAGHWLRVWDASQRLQALTDQVGESPSRRADAERLGELTGEVLRAQRALNAYTWTHRDADVFRAWVELADPNADEVLRVRRPMEYLFNQVNVDLESTWLALYALRVGRERGLLPAALPEIPQVSRGVRRGVPPPQPRSLPPPRQILLDAAAALARIQSASGAFSEANVHQPVRHFDELTALPGVPLPDTPFPELGNPVTLTATAQGFAAWTQIMRLIGLDAMRGYAPRMGRAKALLDGQFDRVFSEEDAALRGGGGLGIAAMGFALLDPGPPIPQADRNLRGDFVEAVLALQRDNGSWTPFRRNPPLVPTVTRQRIERLPSIGRAHRQFDYGQAFTPFPDKVEGDDDRLRSQMLERFGHAQPVAVTAKILLTLSEELRGSEVLGE